jgi:hypothetical protein
MPAEVSYAVRGDHALPAWLSLADVPHIADFALRHATAA